MRIFLLLAIFFTWLLFGSCTKTNNNGAAGISYGITGIAPEIAAAGDTIDIFGAGFSTDTTGNTVTINGGTARVVTARAELLQVIAPAGTTSGSVQVKTGSQSFTFGDIFTLATVISGNQTQSAVWTPASVYLLKGDVHFHQGTSLTIQAGTTILADKTTQASLTIDNGASTSMNGTAASPIVFTSNQAIGLRWPGDWKGITLAANSAATADHITYTRIEFAGAHPSNQPGAALLIQRAVPADSLSYVEAGYSSGDGFRCAATDGSVQYMKYMVSFGCGGNDFSFAGSSKSFGQFLLGLKDPNFADPLSADGLLDQSSQPVTISNCSLVGASGLARGATGGPTSGYGLYQLTNDSYSPNAGRGVHIGGLDPVTGAQTTATLQLFNSMVAAPYLAGISVDGAANWAAYENGGSVIRHTSVTCLSEPPISNLITPVPPLMGYVFSPENMTAPFTGFGDATGSPQYAAFSQYNDSVRLLFYVVPNTVIGPYDDLGIKNMTNYANLTQPVMIAQIGSELYTGADFTDSRLSDTFFDASGTFRGAFNSTDWAKSWCNYNPQQTPYQGTLQTPQ